MTRLWIKNPLAVHAKDAEGGLVIEGKQIAELVPAGREPHHDAVFDASDRDRKSTRLNSSHSQQSRMPSSA